MNLEPQPGHLGSRGRLLAVIIGDLPPSVVRYCFPDTITPPELDGARICHKQEMIRREELATDHSPALTHSALNVAPPVKPAVELDFLTYPARTPLTSAERWGRDRGDCA